MRRSGHIRSRGKYTWELKFDLGTHPLTGNRQIRYRSFKGSKKEANAELARLISGAAGGNCTDRSKLTVGEFFDRWERDWAAHNVSPKSRERYGEIIAAHIRPRIGATQLQKLGPAHLVELYATLLREGRCHVTEGKGPGLSPATVRYVHRVLHRAMGHAVLWSVIQSNPCASVDVPKGATAEIEILTEEQVKTVLAKLKGRPMRLLALMGLATGMRRGELLALRWKDISLDMGRVQIEQSLEQTKAGLRFKGPKTKHGRRQFSISASVIAELRAHRRIQAEQRLALGLGKEPDDALVFRQVDGTPLVPNSITTEWRRLVVSLKLPHVSLHAWRHTHASQLIASGMDVLTISRRLGHGSPSITLNVYGHLFNSSDDRAAAVFERAFGAGLATE
jgi:integrase